MKIGIAVRELRGKGPIFFSSGRTTLDQLPEFLHVRINELVELVNSLVKRLNKFLIAGKIASLLGANGILITGGLTSFLEANGKSTIRRRSSLIVGDRRMAVLTKCPEVAQVVCPAISSFYDMVNL